MSATGATQRRDQRLVAKLVEVLDDQKLDDLVKARARARSLPTMIRRHGPIPVLLFLASKGKEDLQLAEWLLRSTSELLGEVGREPSAYAEELARMPLHRYLLHWQTCVEAAGWLKRLIEARCPDARSAMEPAGA